MPAIEVVTRTTLLIETARMVGALAATGTASAGTTTTIDDALNLIHASNDDLKSMNLLILSGTASGNDRMTSGSTSASSRVTVSPAFSATADSTTRYLLLKRPWRAQSLIDGINAAIRVARGQKAFLLPKMNRELITNDLLMGEGLMQQWNSGTTSAPRGFTLGGTGAAVAREATIVAGNLRYSAALTSDGTNAAFLRYDVRNYHRYRGKRVDLRGFIQTATASRVTMSISDGVTTNTSTAISAAGDLSEWQNSETDTPAVADFTINNNPIRLRVQLDISSGGAVTAYFGGIRLILLDGVQVDYKFPQGDELLPWAYLNEVYLDSGPFDDKWEIKLFNESGRGREFDVVDIEGTKYVRITPRSYLTNGNRTRPPVDTVAYTGSRQLTVDRGIKLVGWGYPDIMDANADEAAVSVEFIKTYAAWYALLNTPFSSSSDNWPMKIQMLERHWREMLRTARPAGIPGTNAIPVEPW